MMKGALNIWIILASSAFVVIGSDELESPVSSSSSPPGFIYGYEYKYNIESRTLTAIPELADQYSGIFNHAILTISAVNRNILIGKLSQGKYSKFHDELPGGYKSNPTEPELAYKSWNLPKEPFVIYLKSGVIHQIGFVNKSTTNEQANQVKGILSQLQFDSKAKNRISSAYSQYPMDEVYSAYYKVMESTVTGQCETIYDASPFPKYLIQSHPYLVPLPEMSPDNNFFEVIKTKNYTNCQQKMGYQYGLSETTPNEMEEFFSKTAVSRLLISGTWNNFTVQSSSTTNKFIISPSFYENEKAVVISQVNLTLIQVQKHANDQPLDLPTDTVNTTLVYAYNLPSDTHNFIRAEIEDDVESQSSSESSSSEEEENEKIESQTQSHFQPFPDMTKAALNPLLPYTVGFHGKFIYNSRHIDPKQEVIKLSREIARDIQRPSLMPGKATLEKFNILTRLLRVYDEQDFFEVDNTLYAHGSHHFYRQMSWHVFRDASIQVGSLPAFKFVKQYIMNERIVGDEAAEVIKTLKECIRAPTENFLKEFFQLVTSDVVQTQENLKMVALLAFSTAIGFTRVNNRSVASHFPIESFDFLAEQKPSEFVSNEVIPYFEKRLREAAEEGNSVEFLFYVRCLGNIGHPKVLDVFTTYFQGLIQVTRFQRLAIIVALQKFTEFFPKYAREVLFQVYQNVAEYHEIRCASVFQLMRTNPPAPILQRMAEYTHHDPSSYVSAAVKAALEYAAETDDPEFSKNARAALKLINPKLNSNQYSRSYVYQYIKDSINLGFTHQYSYFGSQDHVFPTGFFANLQNDFGGFKAPNTEFHYLISSIDDLLNFFPRRNSSENVNSFEKEKEQMNTGKIAKLLKIKLPQNEKLEGQILFKLFDSYRFMAFDNETLLNLPMHFMEYFKSFENGQDLSFSKFYTDGVVTLAYPMETGYPFLYTFKMPTFIHAKGHTKTQQTDSPDSLKISSTNFSFVYSSMWDAKVGFFTPMDHQRYFTGYRKSLQFYVPGNFEMSLDLNTFEVNLEFEPQVNPDDSSLVHFSIVPYTAVKSILSIRPITELKGFKTIHARPVQEFKTKLGKTLTGLSAEFTIQHSFPHTDFSQFFYQAIDQYDLYGFLHYSRIIALPNQFFTLDVDYGKTPIEKVSFHYAYKEIEDYRAPEDVNQAESIATEPLSEQRRDYLIQNVAGDIQNSVINYHDLALKFDSSIPSKNSYFIASFAYAESPLDEKQRFLAFFHVQPFNSDAKQMCFSTFARYPNVPVLNFINALKFDATGQFDFKLNFGETCQNGQQITLKSKFEQTIERKKYVENSKTGQYCKRQMAEGHYLLPACENVTKDANYFDRWFGVVNYQLTDSVQNLIAKSYAWFSHTQGYPYLSETFFEVNNKDENLYLQYEFEPDLYGLNVTLKAPKYLAEFTNLRIENDYVRRLFTFHPTQNVWQRLRYVHTTDQARKCSVGQRYVNTFDNRTYPYAMGNCWHVVLTNVDQDESNPDNEFVVLMRDSNNGDQKEMMIILGRSNGRDDIIKVLPGGSTSYPRVIINEKDQELSSEFATVIVDDKGVQLSGYYLPFGEIKFDIRGDQVQIYYDSYRVRFDANQFYRDYVRGICGTYNGDGEDDFMGPQSCIYRFPQHFAASWALINENCEGSAKFDNKEATQAACFKKEYSYGYALNSSNFNLYSSASSSSSEEESSSSSSSSEETSIRKYKGGKDDSYYFISDTYPNGMQVCETKYQYQYVEYKGNYCFSRRPLPVCETHCQQDTKLEKFVDMVCFPSAVPEAQSYKRQINRGHKIDLSGFETTNKLKFHLPSRCVKILQ